ncbi:MAG: 4Fe-4S dicluster domain-containing protein [Pseudomonadota bacterium]
MDNCTKKIREISSQLFKNKEVEKIIGFCQGTLPMQTNPIIITKEEDIEKLVFNSRCAMNLANYLRDQKAKIAVIAKGCDARNIVTHIVENQVKRDQLYIIGVPCKGMVDKTKIAALFEDDITFFSENQNDLVVCSSSKEEQLNKQDVLKDNCKYCQHRNPVLYDVLAGDLVDEQKLENLYPDVDAIASLSIDEKWTHFQKLTDNCIRCYACKNACPICYCPTCFVDESSPQWVGKGQNKTDVDTFHFLRAFHCAGRCTDCGACVEACPMDINVRDYTRKLNKDCFDLFGWETGLDINKRPPLDVFRPEDPNDNIK